MWPRRQRRGSLRFSTVASSCPAGCFCLKFALEKQQLALAIITFCKSCNSLAGCRTAPNQNMGTGEVKESCGLLFEFYFEDFISISASLFSHTCKCYSHYFEGLTRIVQLADFLKLNLIFITKNAAHRLNQRQG